MTGKADHLLDGSLANAAGHVKRGDVTSLELVSAALDRIEASNSKAFLRVRREAALETARKIDALGREARAQLPLCGVPYARKDLFSVPDEVATFGAHPRFHRQGTSLASALGNMERAGAVDLGALHMSEFAMGPSGWSSVDGAIDNPLDGSRVSGGSSSGTGVAVAARLVHGSIGTDTGGSIRIPAAFCGVVALKPSNGRIPTRGAMPVSDSLDTVGPCARNVADCTLMFEALAGTATSAPSQRRPRFAMLSPESLPVAPDAEAFAALETVVSLLKQAGHAVEQVHWQGYAETNLLAGTVFLAEAAAVHLHGLVHSPELIGPQVRERLLQGLAAPAPLYLAALAEMGRRRHDFEANVLSSCDVLLLPASPRRAPKRADYTTLADTGEALKLNSHAAAYTGAFNYLGTPVLSMPATAHDARNTLGIQIVARNGRDEDALSAARIVEHLLG